MGRFINADVLVSTGQGILGNNMFAYCLNNPVNGLDPRGNVATIFDVASFVYSIVSVALNPDDVGAWLGLAGDAIDLLPGVTGIGEVVKGLVTTDKAIGSFGDLSKAVDFGIESYNKLKKKLKGLWLEAHHIIEKRLVEHLGIDVNTMLNVAVTPAEHQKFTNAWRDFFEYGMDYSSLNREDIYHAATIIYENYPELLKAAYETLFGSK